MNPFGTLFNPASISADLENLVKGKTYGAGDLNFHNGNWLSFDHYTGFSYPDRDKCLAEVNNSVSVASEWLKNTHFLVLTFGTAWVYIYSETGKIVANCHKIPQTAFSKQLMQPHEIIEQYNNVLSLLRNFNPELKVIFTLSPVRHWSDGAVNNQLSKSVLHYSIHEIIRLNSNTLYFPSYEIFMDELRDYRFYAEDMLHPSKQGAEYVWERFLESWIDDASKQILKKIEPVLKATRHRPVNPGSEAHIKFSESTLKKIKALKQEYPFLDFTKETELISVIS